MVSVGTAITPPEHRAVIPAAKSLDSPKIVEVGR